MIKLTLTGNRGFILLNLKSLAAVIRDNNSPRSSIHTREGKVYEVIESMEEIESKFPRGL